MCTRDERLSVDELASIVASRLVSEGFKVHRYDAVTTNSVYLKPDYGACGSIRISDHPGYKHLSYRWNIGSHIDDVSQALAGSYPRSFFPADKWEQLVDQVVDERAKRQAANEYEWRIKLGMEQKERADFGFWWHRETREVAPHA